MPKKTKMGKIQLPMDIRENADVPAFEDMLEHGPMAIVLVYADWCGHCTTYKKKIWEPLKSMKNRTMNMASVHYDQLPKTSLNKAKIEGYPSLLVVGKDKTPATFKSTNGVTNALPKANDFTTMKNLVTSPVVEEEEEEVVVPTSSLKASTLNTNTNTVNIPLRGNVTPPNENIKLPEVTPLTEETTTPTLANLTAPNVNSTTATTATATTNTGLEAPPTISEDVVSLTNATTTNATTTKATTTAATVNPPPVAMMGGRLYRILSMKHRKSKSKKRGATKKRRNTARK